MGAVARGGDQLQGPRAVSQESEQEAVVREAAVLGQRDSRCLPGGQPCAHTEEQQSQDWSFRGEALSSITCCLLANFCDS